MNKIILILTLLTCSGCVTMTRHDYHWIKAAERGIGYMQGLNEAGDLFVHHKNLPHHDFWKETENE
jgi:hypothetical protein